MNETGRRIPVIVCILVLAVLVVSCEQNLPAGGGRDARSEELPPTLRPSWTPIPDDAGSAKLTYKMVVDQTPLFTAVDTEVIPLLWTLPPNDPDFALLFGPPPWKPTDSQPIYGTVDAGSFFVQVEGLRGGEPCFMWFDIPVKYIVKGMFRPYPSCSFSIKISAEPRPSEAIRGENCGSPPGFLEGYPAEILFFHPPQQTVSFPGGALTQTIEINEFAKLVLTLSDIVVAEATGCGGW